jgi:rod shape-determining protein MreB
MIKFSKVVVIYMIFRKNFIGIDFSSTNTQMYAKRYGIIYNEPTLLCHDSSFKNVYIGNEALEQSKLDSEFILINPLIETTFDIFLVYFRLILNKIHKLKLNRKLTLLLSFSIDLNEDEINMLENVSRLYHVEKINIVDPIILTALGNGIDISNEEASMMIFVGATISTLVVFANNKIKIKEELTYSGIYFDEKIINYVKYMYDLDIDSEEAKNIKEHLDNLDENAHLTFTIPNTNITLTSEEIRPLIIEGLEKLVENIHKVIDILSETTINEINKHVIVLAGGLAKTAGIDKYLKDKLNLNIQISKNPTQGIINGMSMMLDMIKNQ